MNLKQISNVRICVGLYERIKVLKPKLISIPLRASSSLKTALNSETVVNFQQGQLSMN